jgi:signal transduction histidine kinase
MRETSPQTDKPLQAPPVLIVSDDADFAHTITSRWQAERTLPLFTLMTGDLCPGINPASFEVAIVGEVRPGLLPSVLTIMEASGNPVVFVASDAKAVYAVRESHTKVLVLRQHEGWGDALILLVGEVLRAVGALKRARNAENAAARCDSLATLGRYMLEMRHSLNDALTSVLGNSELLLSHPGVFSGAVREQIETIRNMSVRMNEILQRFSSLETELRYSDKQLQEGTERKARGSAAGL